jgi:two-component sensor histidine kinase
MLTYLSVGVLPGTGLAAASVVRGIQGPVVLVDTLPDARLLVVTQDCTISTFDGATVDQAYEADCRVYSGAPYQKGHLLATTKGLLYYQDGKGQWMGQLPIEAVDWLHYRGQLYVLGDRALYTLKGDQLEPVGLSMSDPWLQAAFGLLVHDGQLYFITESGLLAYTEQGLTRAVAVAGLNDAITYDGNLVAATQRGLLLLTPTTHRAIMLDGQTYSSPVTSLVVTGAASFMFTTAGDTYHWSGEDYALERLGITADCLSSVNDVWGGRWVGSDDGLQLVSSPDTNTPPRLTITSVVAGGVAVPWQSAIRLRHDEAQVAITYNAVNLHQQKVEVTYSIDDGVTWSQADDQRLQLTALDPGSYDLILRVTGDNQYYDYSPIIKIYVAEAPYPWWLLTALALAVVALVVAMLSLLSARRTARLAQISRDKAIAEQTAIRQEQKALQLQMNPHFLFNALASIQGLLASGRVPEANEMLGTYGAFMRRVLETSRQEYYPLDQELTLLQGYMQLEQMCHGHSFDYTIDCPPDLLEDDISILPMILQPFLENAIEHGVTKVDHRGHISLTVEPTADPHYLQVSIVDNGPGLTSTASSTHTSVALQVVKDRLAKVGGNYQIDSGPSGVSVKIYLPIR